MPGFSIREQIVQQLEILLNGATSPTGDAKPSPLTIYRERLRPLEKEMLPAIIIHEDEDPPRSTDAQNYKSPLVERQLALAIECRAQCPADKAPSTVLDPLFVWAVQVIMGSEQFGGLANGCVEGRRTSISREGDVPIAAAALNFTVKFRTAIADPTKKDPKS
jgi:hypothetical protein